METIKNSKKVLEIESLTKNLKFTGTITIDESGNKLVSMSLQILGKDENVNDSTRMGDDRTSRVNFSLSKGATEASEEKVNLSLVNVKYDYRKEVRDEFNRLLDKYDGITVITKEV